MTVSVAEREPVLVGVKVTVTRHVFSGLMVPELGQVLDLVSRKSPGLAPVRVMLVMFKATVRLVSVRVEVSGRLVAPTATEPKSSELGKSVAVGTDARPVPERAMV